MFSPALQMAPKLSVTDLHYDTAGVLTGIIVKVTDTSEPRCIRRSKWSHKYLQGRCYTKSTFPLRLSYALTVHKCQGATLDFAIVDLAACFCPGLLYVAISRVRNRACLKLLHRPQPEHAFPVPLPSARHEQHLHMSDAESDCDEGMQLDSELSLRCKT